MKNTRKFAAMAAALSLAVCSIAPITMSASAASITINNISTEQTHTFEVYQVFTGTLDSDTNKFTELKWGSGVTSYDSTAVTAGALVSDDIISNLGDDARAIVNKITLSTTKACDDVTSSGSSVTISNLDDGYYIVKDVTDLGSADDANSSYIVQVAGSATIDIKNAKPTVEKKVLDETEDAERGAEEGWGESADHSINETFQFKLKATVPADDNLAAYDTYKLVFHDKMSTGVTFDSIESVKVNGTSITTGYTETATAATNKAGLEWTLTIDDVKSIVNADSADVFGKTAFDVEVIYNAHLNGNAIVDHSDKTNGGTSDTNNNYVYLEYSNNPDSFGEGDGTGETPKDYVWVFTYSVNNTKYKVEKKTGNELAGAEFSLRTDSATGTVIPMVWNETKKAYMPKGDSSAEAATITSQSDGTFNIIGLDAGTYYLVEDKAPDTYEKIDPITITIGATHIETAAETVSLTLTSTDGMDNDAIDAKVSDLPTTGGMGTKIFYVGGGCMVAVAGIFLITKKRMNKKEN